MAMTLRGTLNLGYVFIG